MATPSIPTVLLFGSFLLLLSPTSSTAQFLPFDYAVEGSVGASRLHLPKELPRLSYLPSLSASAAATSNAFNTFYLQPFAGLQFDGVSFKSPANGIDYRDHYAILAFRTGLFVMLRDTREKKNRLVVGLGLETQRPLYVRGSVLSRKTDQKRTWVPIPDPPALEQWGLYWTFRLGAEQKHTIYAVDLTISSKRNTMLSSVLPTNPLVYTSLRFSVLTRLFSTHQKGQP